MSIKSLKSLNDECSEIFERSYSVRSASEESLTCDEDEDSLSRELLNKLTPAVLSKLRRCFKKKKSGAKDIDQRVAEVMRLAAAEEGLEFAAPPAAAAPADAPAAALCLDETGFIAAVDQIFGHHKFTPHARHLFHSLALGGGRVWWRQVVGRMVAAGARHTCSRTDNWTAATVGTAIRLEHCKRETIVKLVGIEREDSFCFAAVSRGGRVGVYSGDMKILSSYEVFYHRTGVHNRVKNCWITDAVYMPDVQCLVMSASDRSLTIYDATTLLHTPIYCITGMPNIPTCLDYCAGGGQSQLACGTERGDIIRIRFLHPAVSLLHTHTDRVNHYYWMELSSPPHTNYCVISTWRSVHSRSVKRVTFGRDGDVLVSCSPDNTVSIRYRHISAKLKDYVFKVPRTARCLHLSPPTLAAGSADGAVRLWEHTQSAPHSCLKAPAAVEDVRVVAALDVVMAVCANCFVYIWDINEECLLQSIKLKFPFLGVLGKRVEFGPYCIHPGAPRKVRRMEQDNEEGHAENSEHEQVPLDRPEVWVSCCDYVCEIRLRGAGGPRPGRRLDPPGDTLRARRPSFWELPGDLMAPTKPPANKPSPPPSPQLLSTSRAPPLPTQDLDQLVEQAGLQGILEKDFVLMKGLKHDLNKKLHEMESSMESMRLAVSVGAPYLALKSWEPEPLPSYDRLADYCTSVIKQYSQPSGATPTGSNFSSPRNSKTFKL